MVFRGILPAGYERTCGDCGYVWQLSRHQARFRPRRPAARPRMGRVFYSRDQTFTDQLELYDQFAHCAVCGARKFSQRPLPDYQSPQ